MVIRPILAEEEDIATKIQSIAFAMNHDFSKTDNDDDQDDDSFKTCRAVFDVSGKMCSCLEFLPYEIMFDQKKVKMAGIGAVATLPEELGKKYAQNLILKCLEEAYERDYLFSYLYPFSHDYYRKFGYELNMSLNSYNIPIDALKKYENYGSVKLFVSDKDEETVKQLYTEFVFQKNLAMIRNAKIWKRFFSKDPFKDLTYIYIYYNKENLPEGYVKFEVNKKSFDNKEIVVNELIWDNFQALSSIFSFLSGWSAQFRNLKWKAPSSLDLKLLFPEPYSIDCQILTHGMNRVINVKKCLEYIKVPSGEGSLTIEIFDKEIRDNSGRYFIEWKNGLLNVGTGKTNPDLICDIRSFTQLVTGFASPLKLKGLGKVSLQSKHSEAECLFSRKDLYINDSF